MTPLEQTRATLVAHEAFLVRSRRGLVWSAMLGTALIAAGVIARCTWPGRSCWQHAGVVVALFTPSMLVLGVPLWIHWHSHLGLLAQLPVCPQCRRTPKDWSRVKRQMASGCCGVCSAALWSPPPAPKGWTRSAAVHHYRLGQRQAQRRTGVALGTMAGVFLVLAILARWLIPLMQSAAADRLLTFFLLALMVAVGLLLLGLAVALGRSVIRWVIQPVGASLPCPGCAADLLTEAAITLRHGACCRCGCQAIIPDEA